jgi:hypothetical protein
MVDTDAISGQSPSVVCADGPEPAPSDASTTRLTPLAGISPCGIEKDLLAVVPPLREALTGEELPTVYDQVASWRFVDLSENGSLKVAVI